VRVYARRRIDVAHRHPSKSFFNSLLEEMLDRIRDMARCGLYRDCADIERETRTGLTTRSSETGSTTLCSANRSPGYAPKRGEPWTLSAQLLVRKVSRRVKKSPPSPEELGEAGFPEG
jgi:hypothetical protein